MFLRINNYNVVMFTPGPDQDPFQNNYNHSEELMPVNVLFINIKI
jgi:hypothetical protein